MGFAGMAALLLFYFVVLTLTFRQAIIFSLLLVSVSFLSTVLNQQVALDQIAPQESQETGSRDIDKLEDKRIKKTNQYLKLEEAVDSENSITIKIKPVVTSVINPISFDISLPAHVGDMGFDLVKVAYIELEDGSRILPVKWIGSPPGGHHRSSSLSFPEIQNITSKLKLVLLDIYGIPKIVFSRDLI